MDQGTQDCEPSLFDSPGIALTFNLVEIFEIMHELGRFFAIVRTCISITPKGLSSASTRSLSMELANALG
jgi:hypothetical protein